MVFKVLAGIWAPYWLQVALSHLADTLMRTFIGRGGWYFSWGIVFFLAAFIFLTMTYFNWILYQKKNDTIEKISISKSLKDSYISFFKKKNIWLMLTFIFFYKFFAAMTEKITPLFLMDSIENGGLGLSNSSLGLINGSLGIIAILVGSFAGGLTIAKFGLARVLIYFCLVTNIPTLLILFLSLLVVTETTFISIIIFIEKFLLGFGSVGQMLFIMQFMGDNKFGMVHYSFGTGALTFSIVIAGGVSGYLQQALGYERFFLLCCIGIPLVLLLTCYCLNKFVNRPNKP